MARGNRLWLHRTATDAYRSETECDADCSSENWIFDFPYKTRPSWETYSEFLQFGQIVRSEVPDLRPRDMIDIQSFIWVLGSGEYDDLDDRIP